MKTPNVSLKHIRTTSEICCNEGTEDANLPCSWNILKILVTPLSSIPQGIMKDVSKNDMSGFTFKENPCVVIHRDDETPTAAIFSSPTQTPTYKKKYESFPSERTK